MHWIVADEGGRLRSSGEMVELAALEEALLVPEEEFPLPVAVLVGSPLSGHYRLSTLDPLVVESHPPNLSVVVIHCLILIPVRGKMPQHHPR